MFGPEGFPGPYPVGIGAVFPSARKMFVARQFFLHLRADAGQELCVEQSPSQTLPGLIIISDVQRAGEECMGGGDKDIPRLPLHQRDLVQRGGEHGPFMEKSAKARAALNPEVSVAVVPADEIVGRIEPGRRLDRVGAGCALCLPDRAIAVEIQQERAERPPTARLQMLAQHRNVARIAMRVDEKFVGIDEEYPMAARITLRQRIDPVNAIIGALVAGGGRPERNILHRLQQLRRAVV